eukprot:gene39934-52719_t
MISFSSTDRDERTVRGKDSEREELQQEKQRLLAEGFPNWTRKDFKALLTAVGNTSNGHGNGNGHSHSHLSVTDTDAHIINEVAVATGKSKDEVKRYLDVFWRRGHELSEWSKVSERLQRGQAQSQREVEIKALLERKLSMYKNPSTELNIQYGCLKGRLYSTEEDIFFLVMMKRFGHGNSGCWERIRREVQSHWRFRFNWLLRSRSAPEIQRRCESLLLALQREEREEQ